jgi:hypothetical protein
MKEDRVGIDSGIGKRLRHRQGLILGRRDLVSSHQVPGTDHDVGEGPAYVDPNGQWHPITLGPAWQ